MKKFNIAIAIFPLFQNCDSNIGLIKNFIEPKLTRILCALIIFLRTVNNIIEKDS